MKEERIVNITWIHSHHHGVQGHPPWTEDDGRVVDMPTSDKNSPGYSHISRLPNMQSILTSSCSSSVHHTPLLTLCPAGWQTQHLAEGEINCRRSSNPVPIVSPALSPALLLFLLMIIITIMAMASDRSEGGWGLETKVDRNYYKSRVRSLFFCATGACLNTFLKGPINHPPSIHPQKRFSRAAACPGRWWLGSRECCLNKCVN